MIALNARPAGNFKFVDHFGQRLLVVQAATVIIASITLVVAALLVANLSEQRTDAAARYSDAAIDAALIQSNVDQLIALGSQEFAAALIASQGTAISSVPIPVIVEARELLTNSLIRSANIERLVGPEESSNIKQDSQAAVQSLDALLATPSPETFSTFSSDITLLRAQASELSPQLVASSASSLDSLRRMTGATRWMLVAAAIVSGTIITATTVLLGQRLAQSGDRLRSERDSLIETTRIMDRRNSQFRALYQVVTEVTENLSTRYVVKTAVREARRLVEADLVALRLLRSDQLTIAGIESSDELDVESLRTISLGTGITGRSAKQGKTIHVSQNAEQEMADEERVASIQSGIVVPLIVGARVVGTLGCWSTQADHFSVDDERILEMMASQVATAVVAADSHEESEKNAHMDPLTGLANRRQLSEDISSLFADKVLHNEPLTIAMIDVDNFGLFNKDFGHRIGDITLQKVAHVLKSTLREEDRGYRYGGEEFLVVLDSSLVDALQIAERLRATVADTPLTGENMQPIGPITISIGVAAFPTHGDTYDVVVEKADEALRAAKRLGRNRVTVWTPETSLEAAA